jgi:cold shock protein
MKTGTVKWFDESRGFGLITQEDGGDVFVHSAAIKDTGSGPRHLSAGQAVTFDLESGPKGLQATNVVVYIKS